MSHRYFHFVSIVLGLLLLNSINYCCILTPLPRWTDCQVCTMRLLMWISPQISESLCKQQFHITSYWFPLFLCCSWSAEMLWRSTPGLLSPRHGEVMLTSYAGAQLQSRRYTPTHPVYLGLLMTSLITFNILCLCLCLRRSDTLRGAEVSWESSSITSVKSSVRIRRWRKTSRSSEKRPRGSRSLMPFSRPAKNM